MDDHNLFLAQEIEKDERSVGVGEFMLYHKNFCDIDIINNITLL